MGFANKIIVNKENIRQNFLNIRNMKADAKAFAVVKANSYGLGALEISKYLENDADGFCVATPEEAFELRRGGIKKQIICMGYAPEALIEDYLDMEIHPAVFTLDLAKKFDQAAKARNMVAPIQIKLDTGHTRIGFMHDDPATIDTIKEISQLPNVKIAGIFSHFACADDEDESFTFTQIQRYERVTSALEAEGVDLGLKHLANDAGIMAYADRVDFQGMRLGIGIYGEYPSDYIESLHTVDLKPAFTWEVDISNVKTIPAGTGVSYGLTWVADRETRLATLANGYADGYFRALSNKAHVLINGVRCPIRGRVCMDQMMVDVTDAGEVNIGDKAYLVGQDEKTGQKVTPAELAKLAGTINYEILTNIGQRVDRLYK